MRAGGRTRLLGARSVRSLPWSAAVAGRGPRATRDGRSAWAPLATREPTTPDATPSEAPERSFAVRAPGPTSKPFEKIAQVQSDEAGLDERGSQFRA
jgi:hypothetical protein